MKHFHRHCRKKYNPEQVQKENKSVTKQNLLDELNFLEISSNLNNSSIKNSKYSDYNKNQIQDVWVQFMSARGHRVSMTKRNVIVIFITVFTLLFQVKVWNGFIHWNLIYSQLLKERRIVSNKKISNT